VKDKKETIWNMV